MGTNFVQHSLNVGTVLTTRTIAVTTAAAQQVLLLTSGAILVNFQNLGPAASVTLGDSGMLMGSGDTVFPYANREFYPIGDGFTTYLRAVSVAAVVAVTEYGVA